MTKQTLKFENAAYDSPKVKVVEINGRERLLGGSTPEGAGRDSAFNINDERDADSILSR